MARGVTLTRLLDELRVEARLSLNPAHNNQVHDQHVIMLQREQERLWEDFDWPHLRVTRYIPVEAGERFYDPIGAIDEAGTVRGDVKVDRIETVEFKSDGAWLPVTSGINAGHYVVHDSALGVESWPVCRWQSYEDDQIEIWPIPYLNADASDQTGYLKIIGIRNLHPLVQGADRTDLDSRMLALYVAGNILAADGAKDAQIKLEAANKIYKRLAGRQIKTKKFNMFGTTTECVPRRPVISHYRPAGT